MRKSKLFLLPILLLCLSLFAGCGSQDDDGQLSSIRLPGQEEQSTSSSDEVVLRKTVEKIDTDLVGMQYYQGEVVEVRRLRRTIGWEEDSDFIYAQDVYLFDMSGNAKLMAENAAGEYNGKWYVSEEGYCLASWKDTLVRIEPDGTETFNKSVENGVVDICQLSDGRIMLLITDASKKTKLAEVDPDTGAITKYDKVPLTNDRRQYIAAGENGLLLLNTEGFWNVNLESGELTSAASWDGYEYMLGFMVQDFRLSESGVIDIVLNDKVDTLMPKNLRELRTVITVWDLDGSESYQDYVDLFNQTNPTYFVEVQGLEKGADQEEFWDEHEDMLINGSGADIVASNAVSDVYGLIQKDVFEDLAPYIEDAGILQDDYFPGAFRFRDGEKIYGVSMFASAEGLAFDTQLLADGEVPDDIETLVDTLLNFSGDEVFHSDWSSEEVLHYFLCGSEDLWGMIDWENKTSSFDGVLFAKMLEAARLFGNGGKKGLAALAESSGAGFYDFDSQESLDERALVYAGYILDRGNYAAAAPYLEFSINSNSANKEGAFEFLSFILSEEVQSTIAYTEVPVNKVAYDIVAKREIEEGAVLQTRDDNAYHTTYKAGSDAYLACDPVSLGAGKALAIYKLAYDLTEEKAAEIKSRLEKAVALPVSTEIILDIICEEAAAYFNETASSVDVCEKIQSRVQQYLDQTK